MNTAPISAVPLTWSYQDGVVDCASRLGLVQSIRHRIKSLRARPRPILWGTAMFLVRADGTLSFGDRSNTPANLEIISTLKRSDLVVPPELDGRSFAAIALTIEDSTNTPPWLLGFIAGTAVSPARLVDLRRDHQTALPGFDTVSVASLFPDRFAIFRGARGDYALRISKNPTEPSTGLRRTNIPRPVDVELIAAPGD